MCALLITACSGTSPSTAPALDDTRLSADLNADSQSRLFGVWEVRVDVTGATVTDITRALNHEPPHYNVKLFLKPPKCDHCLEFSNVSDDPVNHILTADVTITNPTAQQAADIRGIVMSSNPQIYLANPDDYTKVHDPVDPQRINPFRLFLKDQPLGIMFPFGEATETFQIHYDSLPAVFMTAVDAIWHTAEPREPYAIRDQAIDGKLDLNGSIPRRVTVQVLDRQNNVGEVRISSDELEADVVLNPDPDHPGYYYGFLTNAEKKPAGNYRLLITATDKVVSWELFDYLDVEVAETLGEWDMNTYPFPNSGCPRDISAGYDMMMGESHLFYSGGSGCKNIISDTPDMSDPQTYFELEDISSHVEDLSPYPCGRIDTSFAGGLMFISDSDEMYSDAFYTGPMESLVFTLFSGMTGEPDYMDPGDGDAGRMYPSLSTYVAVDITADMVGNMYGIWADPDGVNRPEIYGLVADYTRHDVFMGGALPSSMVGTGNKKVTPFADRIKAISVSTMVMESGMIYILENDGSSSDLEVIQYTVDFLTKQTLYTALLTIQLGAVDAVDFDILMISPSYLPNPDSESIAVLINGPSGGYIRVLECQTYTVAEDIGSETEPLLTGTAGYVDSSMEPWMLVATNQEDSIVVLKWLL
jgi:hypothetical protein